MKEAIAALPRGETLGHNGFPIELFQDTFEEIGGDLLEAFKAMQNLGQLSNFLNKSLIILIPKFGDCPQIGNWCPISLLGSVYKILAKLLSIHIQIHLPNNIQPN